MATRFEEPKMSCLRDPWSFLEIVFVGQCEVFFLSWICIDYFFSLFFPLAAKLIGPKTGCQFLKNVYFFDNGPLMQRFMGTGLLGNF